MAEKKQKFEDKITELEQIINELENGNVSLEDSIEKYTKAMKLVKDCDEQLKNIDLGECLLLPSSMISDYTNHTENKNKFLDDMTVEELESKLNVKIMLTNGSGGQLLRDILGVK